MTNRPAAFVRAFKQCDIRGPYPDEVNEELAYRLGRALGARSKPGLPVAVGGDVRESTPPLKECLLAGLVDAGLQVCDCGLLPTPAYYFARRHLDAPLGVMVTASHSAPDHNGFKPVLGPLPVTPQELQALHQLVAEGEFGPPVPGGCSQEGCMRDVYAAWMSQRWHERLGRGAEGMKVVVDCGNGCAGLTAPEVFEALGLRWRALFCEPNGSFPNRPPDVRPELLGAVAQVVRAEGADLGVAFDGDADRLAVLDERGQVVPSDQLIALLARDILHRRGPGPVVLDIKLSRAVEEVVREAGGEPLRERSGHTFMKTRMIVVRARFGGEMSGHLFWDELDGGDDGLHAALSVLDVLVRAERPLSELVAALPRYAATPDLRLRFEGDAAELLRRLAEHARPVARLEFTDGVKAHYAEGWALVRASVTEPALTLRFEGWDEVSLQRVVEHFLEPAPTLLEQVLARLS